MLSISGLALRSHCTEQRAKQGTVAASMQCREQPPAHAQRRETHGAQQRAANAATPSSLAPHRTFGFANSKAQHTLRISCATCLLSSLMIGMWGVRRDSASQITYGVRCTAERFLLLLNRAMRRSLADRVADMQSFRGDPFTTRSDQRQQRPLAR